MNNTDDLIIDTNDYEDQEKIIEEEKKQDNKYKNNIISSCGFLIFIIIIIIFSYYAFYFYKAYDGGSSDIFDKCKFINIKPDNSKTPFVNITKDNNCKPLYNIDYLQNGRPYFNIDLFGNQTRLFNKINVLENSNCKMNCDSNDDGWPDYNIDLNGDGILDLNIILDYNKKSTCDLNCDINKDMLPDTNIDINGDSKADINITEKNYTQPKYNIDYKGNRTPVFNVFDENGNINNRINQLDNNGKCQKNCDLDNDGWPDYNIDLGNGIILNKLISSNEIKSVEYNRSYNIDWKCRINNDCKIDSFSPQNTYINIDINGDGIPDVNISNDDGKTIINEINKKNNNNEILNYDLDKDGFPEYNIDLNNDGIADINIVDKNNKCIKNCDMNNDGIADYLIYINNNFILVGIDTDYDGKCDVNCDINYDLYPDLNIDTDNDNIPNINIDFDKDGKADFNIDTNNDGLPDINIDVYGLGICNFNCSNADGTITNIVDSSNNCIKNCDTNKDGMPNINVDIDNDGNCDFNCNNGTEKIDSDYNYYEDEKYKNEKNILEIAKGVESNLYIYNPLDILSYDIEPGWNGTYVLKIKNDTDYAVAYKLLWKNVYNDFTNINNLDYLITRSNISYLNNLKAPKNNITLEDEVLIKDNTTIKYVLQMSWKETGENQNIDSGKTFKGQFYIETIQ